MGDLEDFSCDVHQPASHRRDPPEVQDPSEQFDEIQRIPLSLEIILVSRVKKGFAVHTVHD